MPISLGLLLGAGYRGFDIFIHPLIHHSLYSRRFPEFVHGQGTGFEPCPEEEGAGDASAVPSFADAPLFQRVSITGEEDTGGVSRLRFSDKKTKHAHFFVLICSCHTLSSCAH